MEQLNFSKKPDHTMNQAQHIWSMLDELSLSDPDSYRSFISKTLAESKSAIEKEKLVTKWKVLMAKSNALHKELLLNLLIDKSIPIKTEDELPLKSTWTAIPIEKYVIVHVFLHPAIVSSIEKEKAAYDELIKFIIYTLQQKSNLTFDQSSLHEINVKNFSQIVACELDKFTGKFPSVSPKSNNRDISSMNPAPDIQLPSMVHEVSEPENFFDDDPPKLKCNLVQEINSTNGGIPEPIYNYSCENGVLLYQIELPDIEKLGDYELTLTTDWGVKVANLDTSDTGFSSDEDESSGERGCAVGGAENAVDKFSVRPKINNIYEQVRNNLPAIEDNLSEDDSDSEIKIFTRNLPSLGPKVYTDFVDDPEELKGLIDHSKSRSIRSINQAATSSSQTSTVTKNGDGDHTPAAKFESKVNAALQSKAADKKNAKTKKLEDFEQEADRMVREVFASDDASADFAYVQPIMLSTHGLTQNSFDTFLGRVSPDMREVVSPENSSRLDYTDSNIFRPVQNGTGSGDRQQTIGAPKRSLMPSYDPDTANDMLMDKLSKLAFRQQEKLEKAAADRQENIIKSVGIQSKPAIVKNTKQVEPNSATRMISALTSTDSELESLIRGPSKVETATGSTSPITFDTSAKFKSTGISTSNKQSGTERVVHFAGSNYARHSAQIMADPSLLNTQSDSSDSEEDSDRFVSTSRLWHEERRMVKQQINKNQIESKQKSNNRALSSIVNKSTTVELDLADQKWGKSKNEKNDIEKLDLIESWAWPKEDAWLLEKDDQQDEVTNKESAISVSSFRTDSIPDEYADEDEFMDSEESSFLKSSMDESFGTFRPRELNKNESQDDVTRDDAIQVEVVDYEEMIIRRKKERVRLEAIRESRLRLKEQLNSIYKHDCQQKEQFPAYNTEPVYDIDESYSDAIAPLPENSEFKYEDLLLLTIKMNKPNGINIESISELHSHQKDEPNNSMQSIGCFCAVLTWLLSLAKSTKDIYTSYQKVRSSSTDSDFYVPFSTVSMQQTVLQSELIVHVAICPAYPISFLRDHFLKTKKKPKAGQGSNKNIFYQIVSKFLSSVKLQDVIDWDTDLIASRVLENHVYKPRISDCLLSSIISISGDKKQSIHLFDSLPGFFWHTINTPECLLKISDFDVYLTEFDSESASYSTENAVCLVDEEIYGDRIKMYHLLMKLLHMQLDLSGLRLLHPTVDQLENSVHYHQFKDFSKYGTDKNTQVSVLALALRGHNAFNKWNCVVGHLNPVLAKITEPNSLTAMFGSDSSCYIYVPRNHSRQEFVKYFGTRLDVSSSVNTKECRFYSKLNTSSDVKVEKPKKSHKDMTESSSDDVIATPPSMLCAVIHSNIILIISPLVPFQISGYILSVCQEYGFEFRGLRRSFMDHKTSHVMGIPNSSFGCFFQNDKPEPATCIRLSGENASSHCWMLINNIYNHLWGRLSWRIDPEFKNKLFFCVNETAAVIQCLGGDFESSPNHLSTGSLPRYIDDYETDIYTESLCVVCFVGKAELRSIGFELGKLSNLVYESRFSPQYDAPRSTTFSCEEMEILGIKYRTKLTKSQSRELTVFEVGDPSYSASLEFLSNNPCVTVCVRGLNVFEKVKKVFSIDSKGVAAVLPSHAFKNLTRFMSYNTKETYKLMKLFFDDSELFSDDAMRTTLSHKPCGVETRAVKLAKLGQLDSQGRGKQAKQDLKGSVLTVKVESIYSTILAGPSIVPTCFLVKPDACFRFLPFVLRTIYKEKFSVLGTELLELGDEHIKFLKSQLPPGANSSSVFRWCDDGPVCVIAVERTSAVTALLQLIGQSTSDPLTAKRLFPKSWTAQFGRDEFENGFLVPQTYEESASYLNFFFPKGVLHSKSWNKMSPGSDRALTSFQTSNRTLLLEKDRLLSEAKLSQEGNASNVLSTAHSLLNQVNILILPSNLLNTKLSANYVTSPYNSNHLDHTGEVPVYVDILIQLKTKGVNILGLRMLSMSAKQSKQVLKVLGMQNNQQKMDLICGGPCLAMAFHRDNAVICFEQMLGSTYDGNSLYSRYNDQIIRPTSLSEANVLLPMLFESLIDNDYGMIICP